MKIFVLFILLFFSKLIVAQQALQKVAKDALLVTQMANKFHVAVRPLNETFSKDVFEQFLQNIDPDKLFFTQKDMALLQVHKNNLHQQIINQKTDFIQLVAQLYKKRLQEMDTMLVSISKNPFNFSIAEKFTVAEDTSYAQNSTFSRLKLYKTIKLAVLDDLMNASKNILAAPKTVQKKLLDSIELAARKKEEKFIKRFIQRQLNAAGGLEQLLGEDYCKAISTCYDPHSEYMSLNDRENFEGQLGNKQSIFGFSLAVDDKERVYIDDLVPGGAAFKSGVINKGDYITSIQWGNNKAIDVSDASIDEVASILDESNHDIANISIKKADGSTRVVSLAKEKEAAIDDDEKVKSYILKGVKNIGYISLPSFYTDWENTDNINGCANDVAKEIAKLKRENIAGLIIDVRYNGGGSVQEAVDLVGNFIDGGPVALIKDKNAKAYTLKDVNRGTVYDGPMVIMVNGYSASASELLAGSLQDYNRAIILGSTTFGKATGQNILPLDTTINQEQINESKFNDSYTSFIKLTLSQLYRVNGSTAQFNGVVPDVQLPDASTASKSKEKNLQFAIKASIIDANKYYKPLVFLPVKQIQAFIKSESEKSPYFTFIEKYNAEKLASAIPTDINLQFDINKLAITEKQEEFNSLIEKIKIEQKDYVVINNQFMNATINVSENQKKINQQQLAHLQKDPYILMAFKVFDILK